MLLNTPLNYEMTENDVYKPAIFKTILARTNVWVSVLWSKAYDVPWVAAYNYLHWYEIYNKLKYNTSKNYQFI